MGTNTGIGIGIGIPFKNNVLGEGKPYLPPEIKDSLKAVVIAYGKTNNDSDRAIVKNLVDASNPFVISNAAFKLNSGFGKYETELSNTKIWTQSKETTSSPFSSNYNGLSGWIVFANTELTNSADMPSFKIQVKGLLEGQELIYRYYDSNGQSNVYSMGKDGEYTLPADIRTAKPQTSNTSGFQVVKNDTNTITITQIPSFEGAFVTDGVNDLIASAKTIQEMGITDEITVVSMIHKISSDNNWTNLIGELKGDHTFVANRGINTDKTGIYGYTYNYNENAIVINNILGDKNDYIVRTSTSLGLDNKYYVTGFRSAGIIQNISQVAWYWTFIANRVLTTDEINQVIAYYNLDRTLKPDMLCNITKQGITNDNHADFNDKLIDYSGNGRDIQMYNLAWKGGSGIAAKKFETIKDYNIIPDEGLQELTIYNEFSFKIKSIRYANRYWAVQSLNKTDMSYPVTIITDKDIIWRNALNYTDADGVKGNVKKETNVPANTPTQVFIYGFNDFDISDDYTKVNCVAYATRKDITEFTVTFIPSYKGGLLLDGVNDFGQFVGDLGLKDYTLIINRAYNNLINNQVPLISSNIVEDQTPFIVEYWNTGSNAVSFSYGASRITDIPLDINKKIVYQSTYSYMGYVIPKGNAISTGGGITLGKFGNGVQYSAICLWSLMLFPYSMSEFLIERQLKKHKLGTLYPDMVEFRPVITINGESGDISYANDKWENINIGDYINIGEIVHILLYRKDIEEISNVKVNGAKFQSIDFDSIYNHWNINIELTSKSPQKIDITIDEYIRYEDIVQPYPVLLRFNDENGNEVSWGGKFRVGSTITRIGSAADSNLLPNIYNIFGLLLNGNQVTSSKVIVEKTMVFKAKSAYIFDNNEPKCILSPRLLRIPNSSYKILGYIPDISGHGNHGKINNSAYAGMSGANGYKQDFTSWKTSGSSYSIVTDSKYILTNEKAITNGGYFLWNRLAKDSFKVKISNIPNGGWMSYRYKITEEDTQFSSLFIRKDGIYTLPATIADSEVDFFISTVSAPAKDWIGLTIEQIGEYEGAYCLDGVDDFVTIPTLSSGGKQVLMKVNSRKSDCYLYDQRNNWTQYLGIVSTKDFIAYNYSNQRGKTYIDGILNENITANDLIGITHNITVTNNRDDVKQYSPCIGASFARNSYAQMALYDFMLFDNISTDDKIKELNEYVGIEAKVELPPYYWDTYGKTNFDADRDTIQQRGIAVGDYDLTNYNHAYNKISGYGGYSFKSFNDSQGWNIIGDGTGVEIVSRDGYSITIKKLIQNLGWQISNNEYKYPTILDKELPFKCVSNKKVSLIWQLKYKTEGATFDTTVTLINQQLTPNVPLEINLPYKTQDELTELGAVSTSVYYLLYFSNTTLEIGEEYTVEMLPLYPNGLLYDAVTDYSENVNIPVFTDFTAIMKRKWLKNQGCPLIKGSKVYEGGNGNALLFEWDEAYNFVFYKRTDIMEGEVPDNISFITPTNYNGNVITRGSEQDTNGICIAGDGNAGFANMVFYKLILYPKTIPLLQINFLKNLMEKDEIIDLTNPIFIKNE